jgi:hypothetical protein
MPDRPALSALLAFAAVSLASGAAGATTVYGSVTCEASTGACDACPAIPAPCNMIGQTTGPRSTCAPGAAATVSAPSNRHTLTTPSVVLTHWGNYWSAQASEAAGDVDAWETIGRDWRFWQPLSEYSAIPYTSGSTIPFSSATVTTAVPAMNAASASNTVTISDVNDIQNELIHEMVQNVIPMPDSQKIYVVVLPPYVQTAGDGFSGYHSWFSFNGQYVFYAVIPQRTPPASFANPQFPTAEWRPRDYLISHELYEATTDPLWSLGSGWSTSGCGSATEVADLCEFLFANPIDGFTVATFWSNASNGCVGPASLDTRPPPKPTRLDGCGYMCNENYDTLQQSCATISCRCYSPAQCCEQAGGYWDGKYCE